MRYPLPGKLFYRSLSFIFISLLVGLSVTSFSQIGIFTFTGTSTGDNQFNSVTTQPSGATFSTFTRTGVNWVATTDQFS
ncbi:MAG TPA: hypothetical protein VK498_04940, partial [Ferruginibacter sp.]|nr:hypothetical protein [Ferruginibacter sp.]